MSVSLFVPYTNLHHLTDLYHIWYTYRTQLGKAHKPCIVSKLHQDHKKFSKRCWLFSITRQRPDREKRRLLQIIEGNELKILLTDRVSCRFPDISVQNYGS